MNRRVAADPRRVLVTGAGSLVGSYLLPRLLAAGFEVHALGRRARAADGPVRWHALDLADRDQPLPADCAPTALLIHVAPLWLLAERLEVFARCGVHRLVAFGSTSRFSKFDSGAPAERAVARRLAEAEAALAVDCERLRIRWTLLRPTLIYGGGRDKNVATIARFIARFGFFPLLGSGSGLRQPVHADDLAGACLAVLERDCTGDQAYNLSGGETLSYRDMVEAIFAGLGRRPRFVRVPLGVLWPLVAVARLLPTYRHIDLEMFNRMNRDLCFGHEEAARDFGFAPRLFRAEISDGSSVS